MATAMTEETSAQTTLKPFFRLFYAFIKWTAVTISLILLIIAFLLAMPWRVLLVLSVIPTIGIFMPRDLQKWCWMAMTAVVIGLYVWIRIPEQNASQWRPYVFEQKIAAYLRKGQIPDSPNAAIRYAELFARHDEDLFAYPIDHETDVTTYLEPWDENNRPELARWLKTLDSDMTALIMIAQTPDCRFPPSVDIKTLDEQFKRINTMKTFVRDMLRSANQDLYKSRLDAALTKQLTVLRMARHFWRQKTLLDQATGYFLERMARRAMSRFVIDYAADTNTLQTVENAWIEADSGWPDCWRKIMDSEKMLTVGVSGLFYQQNEQGHIRFSRNITDGLRRHMGSRISKYPFPSEMSRMIALVLGLTLPAEPEGTARLIEQRFDRYSIMVLSGVDLETTTPEEWWQDGLNASTIIDWYARQRVGYYYAINGQNSQFERNRTVMKILISLKRYQLEKGTWPDSLTQVFTENPAPTDPVSQKPFVYKKQTDSFTLYSIGPNGIDDGGIKNSYAKPKQDDTLFWPAAGPAKTEEQNGTVDNSAK
jgi:hypothetical protein